MPEYRVTLQPPADREISPGGVKLFPSNFGNRYSKDERLERGIAEKLWTPAALAEKLNELRVKNEAGLNVYITPLAPDRHFVVVDDLLPATLPAFLSRYQPALVQESSQERYQAVLIVDGAPSLEGSSLEIRKNAANDFFKVLNKELGDPKISGLAHPCRLAGFKNAKPSRNWAPTVILSTNPGRLCQTAAAEIAALEQKLVAESQKKRMPKLSSGRPDPVSLPGSPTVGLSDELTQRFRFLTAGRQRLADQKGWGNARLHRDLAVIETMLLTDGVAAADVVTVVFQCSEKALGMTDLDKRWDYAAGAVQTVADKHGLAVGDLGGPDM